ncbi:TIGR02234 family membrane protein [Thermopolyspora sp. NPDC052614]|uniref:TIGR02234 family membrane protein n=1 Tax=Thermopolyspora sp. NPDC052614 TaxID=3155682 RepID=UPI0034337849
MSPSPVTDTTSSDSRPPVGGASRRPPLVWALVCAAGAGAVLLAAGREWARVRYGAGGGSPLGLVTLTGSDLAAYLGPAALASLAAVVAVLVARGMWRRLIGVVVALGGVAAVLGAFTGVRRDTILAAAAERSALSAAGGAAYEAGAAWPAVTVAGGIILVGAGIVAVARASRWPGMSERYERRGAGSPPPARGPRAAGSAPGSAAGSAMGARADRERELWDALDRGDDPTADGDGAGTS